jgi:hypothetical protein
VLELRATVFLDGFAELRVTDDAQRLNNFTMVFLKDSVSRNYGLYGRDAAVTMALSVGMSFNSGALLLNVRM